MPIEPDITKPLEQAIEEFHKLREISSGLWERAQWPNIKVPQEERSSVDEEATLEVPVR